MSYYHLTIITFEKWSVFFVLNYRSLHVDMMNKIVLLQM